MTRSRRYVVAASAALAAIVAAPSLAAYICHPDPRGTRRLTVAGFVERYVVAGPHVSVAVRSSEGCKVVAWNTLTGLQRTTGASCLSLLGRSLSTPAALRTFVTPANSKGPDTLNVFRGTVRIANWPLPAKPRVLHVADGYALFSATDGGTYALRLGDGRVAALGPAAAGDVPQISELGAVFAERHGYSSAKGDVLKFIPTSGINAEVDRNARPLRTGGAIQSLAMDGPRVALAVRDRAGRCDRVVYLNVLRAPAQRISAPVGPTCVPGQKTQISAVAIGGFRTEWLAASGNRASLVIGSPRCQEWVVRRLGTGPGGEDVVGMAADGKTLAFAVTNHERELRGLSSIDVIAGTYSPRTIITGRGQPVALSVDGNTIATLFADGTVDVRTARGRSVARFAVGTGRAIALSDGKLVVLRATRLDVYSLASRNRIHAVRIPRVTVNALDAQYGIAVVAAGRNALAVDLATGAVAVVGSSASPVVGAAIERPGVAFASTSGDRGLATFVPLARVQALLGGRTAR
jgi:hypothetical protein